MMTGYRLVSVADVPGGQGMEAPKSIAVSLPKGRSRQWGVGQGCTALRGLLALDSLPLSSHNPARSTEQPRAPG